jgi:hypothetical protein
MSLFFRSDKTGNNEYLALTHLERHVLHCPAAADILDLKYRFADVRFPRRKIALSVVDHQVTSFLSSKDEVSYVRHNILFHDSNPVGQSEYFLKTM